MVVMVQYSRSLQPFPSREPPKSCGHTLLLGSRAQQCEGLFPVTVSLSELVGGLKEAIKDRKQNTLNHIEAHQLEIWIPRSLPAVTDVVEALGSVGH